MNSVNIQVSKIFGPLQTVGGRNIYPYKTEEEIIETLQVILKSYLEALAAWYQLRATSLMESTYWNGQRVYTIKTEVLNGKEVCNG